MSFIPSFTATQLYATPTILRIVDTSTGSDSEITGRKVYLRQANGDYLVPSGITTNYIDWAIGDSFIDIDVLDIDYALEIKVEWDGIATYRVTEDGNSRVTQSGDNRITE